MASLGAARCTQNLTFSLPTTKEWIQDYSLNVHTAPHAMFCLLDPAKGGRVRINRQTEVLGSYTWKTIDPFFFLNVR